MSCFNPPTTAELIQRQEDFFSSDYKMSYSGLTKLLFSPKLFYMHYILNQKQDIDSPSAVKGRVVHCLLLTPEEFDNDYLLMTDIKIPASSKELLNRLFRHYKELQEYDDPRQNLEDFKLAILDLLQDMDLYQKLKTDEDRIKKIITPGNEEYWEYLKAKEKKILVTNDVYNEAIDIVNAIKAHPYIMELMCYDNSDKIRNIEVFSEIELSAPTSLHFGIKGIIDNLVVDHTTKIVRINDLKNTSKSLQSFEESISFYEYWIQASIYCMLAAYKYPDYKIEFRFIVADAYTQIGVIKVSDETLADWILKTVEKLEEANYHFINRNFDLPYKFLINKEVII